MSDITFDVDIKAVENSLIRYKQATGKTWGEVLGQSLRRLAVNLAYQTQPFGKDKTAQNQGMSKVEGDIRKVYYTIGKIYGEMETVDKEMADAFYAAAQKKDWKSAERILKGTPIANRNIPIAYFDGGSAHSSRFVGGRLRGKKYGSQLVTTESSLNSYIKRKQRLVGFAKAGWAGVAEKLGGTRGIPAWAKRNRAPSSVKDRTKGGTPDPKVIGTNEVTYTSKVLSASQIRNSASREERVALNQAKKAERAAARKARLL